MTHPYIILSDHTRHYFDLSGAPTIETIAHALSHINRWTGHTKRPFSVAQHSLLTSYLVPQEFATEALLHDATEAYLGDVSAPLKALLPDYQRIESEHWAWLADYFGLPVDMSPEVKYADLQSLALEKYYLMGDPESERLWPTVDMKVCARAIATLNNAFCPTAIALLFIKRYKELAEC